MAHEKNKIFDEESFAAWEKETIETMEKRQKLEQPVNEAFGGPLGTDVPEPKLHYIRARNEKVIKKKNAYITFGTDRPTDKMSGWGGKGAQRANRIDIVVGRLSSKPQDSGTLVNNCFSADAARIYISQATNIDDNFGLVHGATPPVFDPSSGTEQSAYAGLSGIGIKADTVRLIGREGIKIVTGKMDWPGGFAMKGETNARGGKIRRSSPPIELIAGNDDGEETFIRFDPTGGITREVVPRLQGVAQGERTSDAFLELSEILDSIWSVLYSFVMEQLVFNVIVAGCSAGAATSPASNSALAPIGTYLGKNLVKMCNKMINPLWHTRTKKLMWELNYLQPYGYKYICSRNVFTT